MEIQKIAAGKHNIFRPQWAQANYARRMKILRPLYQGKIITARSSPQEII